MMKGNRTANSTAAAALCPWFTRIRIRSYPQRCAFSAARVSDGGTAGEIGIPSLSSTPREVVFRRQDRQFFFGPRRSVVWTIPGYAWKAGLLLQQHNGGHRNEIAGGLLVAGGHAPAVLAQVLKPLDQVAV